MILTDSIFITKPDFYFKQQDSKLNIDTFVTSMHLNVCQYIYHILHIITQVYVYYTNTKITTHKKELFGPSQLFVSCNHKLRLTNNFKTYDNKTTFFVTFVFKIDILKLASFLSFRTWYMHSATRIRSPTYT